MNDVEVQIIFDEMVKCLKAAGKSRDQIEQALHFEVERACDEQFDGDD